MVRIKSKTTLNNDEMGARPPHPRHQQFSLRWNNYSQHIVNAVEQLRIGDEFTDVTLSCDEGSVKAHRLVLSACSTFFRDMFLETPTKRPIVILDDITFHDLKAVVQFMYKGQVNVAEDKLPSFLRTAELLRIKGLIGSAGSGGNVKDENGKKPSPTAGNGSSSNSAAPSQVEPSDSNLGSTSNPSCSSSNSVSPDSQQSSTGSTKRKRTSGDDDDDNPNEGTGCNPSSDNENDNENDQKFRSSTPIPNGGSGNNSIDPVNRLVSGLLNPHSVVIPPPSRSTSVNSNSKSGVKAKVESFKIIKYDDDDGEDSDVQEIEPPEGEEEVYNDDDFENDNDNDDNNDKKLKHESGDSDGDGNSVQDMFCDAELGSAGESEWDNTNYEQFEVEEVSRTNEGYEDEETSFTSYKLKLPARNRARARKTPPTFLTDYDAIEHEQQEDGLKPFIKVVSGVPQYTYSTLPGYRNQKVCGDQNIDFKFVVTKPRTREKLVVNGNAFRYEKCVNTSSYWKCFSYPECKARVTYQDGRVGFNDKSHCHQPNEHVLLRELPIGQALEIVDKYNGL